MASTSASAFGAAAPMDVQRLVNVYGGGVSRQHGTAERGRYRQRSRERFNSQPAAVNRAQTQIRSHPSGPQETIDWLEALERFEERLSNCERYERMHAQTLTSMEEQAKALRAAFKVTTDDIFNYKNYVESKFKQVSVAYDSDRVKFASLDNAINIGVNETLNALTGQLKELNDRYKALDAAHESLVAFVHQTARNEAARETAKSYDISSQPGHEKHDPMSVPAHDPWANPVAGTGAAACTGAAAPNVDPNGNSRPNVHFQGGQAQSPGANDPLFSSPFEEVRTPPSRPALWSTPLGAAPNPGVHGANLPPPVEPGNPFVGGAGNAYQAGHAQHHQWIGAQGHHGIGYAPPRSAPTIGNFEISYKPNEALKKFSGDSANYKTWADRIMDHLARGNSYWRTLLKSLQACTLNIQRSWLEGQWVQGVCGWDLSEKLENFIMTYVGDSLYSRRIQLAGGEAQAGNGFEIWRKLYQEHHGGAEAVKLGGIRRLQEWPKCSNINNLNQHLDAWKECLETHNQELLNAPNVLRSMIMGIIPNDYEDEILVRPEIQSWEQIIEFCQRRTAYKRQKMLSEMTRRGHDGKINSLQSDNDEEAIPSWAKKMFAMQINNSAPPPPAPVAAQRPSRAEREDSTAALRAGSPGGRRAFNAKFRFAGCWHCGDKGHSRKANPAKGIAGCPKFEKLKQLHGGKTPEGYKGAYEKARDLAWEKAQSKKADKKVNHLDDDQPDRDDDDEDSRSDVEDSNEMCLALTSSPGGPNFEHANPFQELAEEDLDDEMIAHFASWAHKVRIDQQPRGPEPVPKKTLHIASLKELDDQMKSNPRLAALPTSSKGLQRKLRKLAEKKFDLADDEMLALVDTGSNIHAADVETHFPDYVDSVRETAASRRGHSATAAGGQKLFNLGRFVVHGHTDGQDVRIPFNNMKVKLPILSVREMMSKGSRMTLTETGGIIENREKKQAINFIVHDDLWYVKLKVKPPPANDQPESRSSLFGRQGSR